MCGVAGRIGGAGTDEVQAMIDTLAHRGPDGIRIKTIARPGAKKDAEPLAVLAHGGRPYRARIAGGVDDAWSVDLGDGALDIALGDDGRWRSATGAVSTAWADDHILAFAAGATFEFHDYVGKGDNAEALAEDAIRSPMPGRVVAVAVAVGDAVAKGQALVTLEAMKMEHALTAPFDGRVAELTVTAGDQVAEGVVLARLEKAE